jgi:hypothetical protein
MKRRYITDCIQAATELGVVSKNGPLHTDAGESLFLERQLEAVETRLYEQKLRELRYRKFIPITGVAGAGAATITYYLYTKVGMAKIIANPSDDLPRSDVYATRHTMNVHNEGTSFGYSTSDLRQAVFAGVPLDTMKADAARRGIHELENTLAWTGDSDHGIVGFLANPNIPTVQAPQNAGATSRAWADKTADEQINDVRLLTSGIRTATRGVHEGNVLLVPQAQYDIMANTPRSTHSDTTVLQFITNPGNSFGLSTVDWLFELEGAGTGGSDMALCYELDDEVLQMHIPMEMQMLPPQARNMEFIIPVEAEVAGVVVRYPLACRTLYDI